MELFIKRVVWCIMMLLNIITIIAVISYFCGFFLIDISRYNIISKKIPSAFNGFKILQLSDLHNRTFGKNNSRLLKKIEKETPDIIVLTGDMVSANSSDWDNFLSLSREISKKYPTYFILGNHEQSMGVIRLSHFLNSLKATGVKILNNDMEEIGINDEKINLYGLFYDVEYYKGKKEFTSDLIRRSIGEVNETTFNILLSHNPLFFDTYEEWGADLVLSGHVHGGIIRIPGWFGLLSPDRTLFPKYYAGMYETHDADMIVSRGLGDSILNLRIFNNPEICVITLKSSE